MDDPLRVIRCVRFASRYGFDLVPELAQAARDPEIQVYLHILLLNRGTNDLNSLR